MKILPLFAALALALTPLPARADLDRDDAVKILGGLAALYLLNEAMRRNERRNGREEQSARPARTAQPGQPGETYSHVHADGSGGGWHDHVVGIPHSQQRHGVPEVTRAPLPPPAPLPEVARGPLPEAPLPAPPTRRPVEVKLLPEQCRADVSNAVEIIEGYDAQCLQNAVVLPGSLPPACLIRHPDRTLYEARCLRAEGWTTRLARN
ncbi:hypothetical protein [Jannaschia seohaensis]|uniref:Uncharacterized protein n=1 Tax=Jannaschia seohaensis TaxID=475081 RepID=A0A2Y9C822_9RHOB|nr:hypothetical protein [Jannaschia seohaensis]PWJ17488.1 hypothetical protein BCF38_10698 [Jannaschia seohaensis]SSA47583.1 hypothetical protein SAMN05421539_10698 [Jannaschia seohaensis]